MDKNINVRVVGFPKGNYDKKWLDTLNDRERSDAALADGDAFIYVDLREFQDEVLNKHTLDLIMCYWYFLTDLA